MTDQSHKDRVRDFYELVSPYFREMWGEHLHDGYYESGDETKEEAQDKLVAFLAREAGLERGSRGLDIGCGMGATSVQLARELGCQMTGVTLSPYQVQVAQELAEREKVEARFLLQDAECMRFEEPFDFVWMMGVLGHMSDQRAFLSGSAPLLRSGGRFVLADWVAHPRLTDSDRKRHVEPVLEGMLMPSIASLDDYVEWFEQSGYQVRLFRDIAATTMRTWEEGVSLIQAPHLYRLALDAGRDALNLMSAIRGMRKAMGRGHIGYGIVVAEKI